MQKYDLAIALISYNCGDNTKDVIDHLENTTKDLKKLYILVNSGSVDNTRDLFNNLKIDKIIVNYTFEQAFKNHYALSAAANDILAITDMLKIPYLMFHDIDAFIDEGGAYKMYETLDTSEEHQVSVTCPPYDGYERIHEGPQNKIEVITWNSGWTTALVKPGKFIKHWGWWSEALMPAYMIDNDINKRINCTDHVRLIDYSFYTQHLSNVASANIKKLGVEAVNREDGLPYPAIYNIMWGGNPGEEKNKYPLNDLSFLRGVSYELGPMVDKIVLDRVKSYNLKELQ